VNVSLEALITECHRRGYRVGDLSELRAEPGVWRARLWTRAEDDTDFSTGRSAEVALRNALNEITAGPGSERGRDLKRTAKKPAPKPAPAPPPAPDLDDLLA